MQQPDFSSSINAGMNMASLMKENQMKNIELQQAKQQFADQQAIKAAQDKNTSIDPSTGNISIDKKGVLSDLVSTAPHLAPQMQMQYTQQEREQQSAAMQSDEGQHRYLGQMAAGVNDQAGWDNLLSHAKNVGVPQATLDQYGPTYDPNVRNRAVNDALSAADQKKNEFEKQKIEISKQESNVKLAELNRGLNKDQASQVQETLQSLQSARGNPAVQRAEQDVYSNSKVNKLVSQGVDKKGNFDPNQLNNTQVRLLAGEVAKIATGGAPTMDELHGLTPQNMPQWLSGAAEKYKNSPTGANAGLFVKQLQNYSNGVGEDAKALLRENYQGIIESKKQYLPPSAYKTLNDQFIGRLSGDTPASEWSLSQKGSSGKPSSPGSQAQNTGHPQDSMAVQWAKSNPNDPRAAKILNLNGINLTAGK